MNHCRMGRSDRSIVGDRRVDGVCAANQRDETAYRGTVVYKFLHGCSRCLVVAFLFSHSPFTFRWLNVGTSCSSRLQCQKKYIVLLFYRSSSNAYWLEIICQTLRNDTSSLQLRNVGLALIGVVSQYFKIESLSLSSRGTIKLEWQKK